MAILAGIKYLLKINTLIFLKFHKALLYFEEFKHSLNVVAIVIRTNYRLSRCRRISCSSDNQFNNVVLVLYVEATRNKHPSRAEDLQPQNLRRRTCTCTRIRWQTLWFGSFWSYKLHWVSHRHNTQIHKLLYWRISIILAEVKNILFFTYVYLHVLSLLMYGWIFIKLK